MGHHPIVSSRRSSVMRDWRDRRRIVIRVHRGQSSMDTIVWMWHHRRVRQGTMGHHPIVSSRRSSVMRDWRGRRRIVIRVHRGQSSMDTIVWMWHHRNSVRRGRMAPGPIVNNRHPSSSHRSSHRGVRPGGMDRRGVRRRRNISVGWPVSLQMRVTAQVMVEVV